MKTKSCMKPEEAMARLVLRAMNEVDSYHKHPLENMCWWNKSSIVNVLQYGAACGWLHYPSITQVQWSQKGADDLTALIPDEVDFDGKKRKERWGI